MSNWTAASSDCSRPANNYVRVNTVDLYTPNARFTQERLGYQVLTLFGKLGYSHIEVFAKDLSDLTQFAPRLIAASDELDFDEFFYHGDGTVRGGEVLVQKRTGRHTGWVAYTLSKVEESFPRLEPDPFPATHDQRHELKIVSIFEAGRWHFTETFVYASGKPYTEPVGLEPVELPFGGTIDRVVAGVKNGSRLPDYHRLDLAINREVPFGGARGIFSLTLFNAYDRQNTWYKEFNVVEGEIVENNILLMGLTLNASLSVKF